MRSACPGSRSLLGPRPLQPRQCHCDAGFFGKDCAHTKHDCVHLRSCGDCNNAANTRFCGWCAAAATACRTTCTRRAAQGGACQEWHEDSCPRRARATAARPRGADEDDGEDDDERGDDRSVAFAEALVAMIDERAGKGIGVAPPRRQRRRARVARCALHEQRAADRRLRYEAYMAEEAELRAPVAATRGSNHSPFAPTPGSRRLGDAPLYDTLATDRLAAALGSGDGGGGGDGGGADAAAAAAAADAVSPEAAATLTAASVREAARRGLEERKQLKREPALARQQAERAARDEREERARQSSLQRCSRRSTMRGEAAAAPAAGRLRRRPPPRPPATRRRRRSRRSRPRRVYAP